MDVQSLLIQRSFLDLNLDVQQRSLPRKVKNKLAFLPIRRFSCPHKLKVAVMKGDDEENNLIFVKVCHDCKELDIFREYTEEKFG
ncbi:MAG: hypothetical protein J4F36_13990 [Nitrosopumilaceae archaeon]|nr:hypothetical protein [Nitrosopumilaceae archaeon]